MKVDAPKSFKVLLDHLCKFIAGQNELCLSYKTSVLSAAATTMALNVATNEALAAAARTKVVPDLKRPSECPLSWWNSEVLKYTRLDLKEVQGVYVRLATVLD